MLNERDFEGDGQRFQFSFRKRESMKEKSFLFFIFNNLADLGKCESLNYQRESYHEVKKKKEKIRDFSFIVCQSLICAMHRFISSLSSFCYKTCEILLIEHVLSIHKATNKKHQIQTSTSKQPLLLILYTIFEMQWDSS